MLSVLVNRSQCGLLESTKGLHQGDPLFPLLFVIVMKALSRMVDKATGCLLSRFKVDNRKNNDLIISHLLFADDTLIFCEAESR